MSPVPRPGILDVKPYVGGRSTAEAARTIKLSSNESGIGPSPRAMEAYRAEAATIHRYPDGGHLALRQAIGAHFGLAADRIVCGAGSDELISLLVRSYAGPGDEVLQTEHGFSLYGISARQSGADVVKAPERSLHTDVDALLARVTPRTKIVFVANPNNPTGTYIPATEIERLHMNLPRHVLLALDSAYAEFVDAADYDDGADLVRKADNVVMLRTFSKLFGLGALRLGWCFAPEGIVDVLSRMRAPFNVGTPALAAGVAALSDEAFIDRALAHNAQWRGWLTGRLNQLGLDVVPSVTNFLLVRFPDEPGRTAADCDAYLSARGILTRNVDSYGLKGYLRISIGLEDECVALGDAVAAFLRGE